MSENELIRVFVGADRSQQYAIEVLAYSIRKHTSAHVEVIPMVDFEFPEPTNPNNRQRTGFSFSRFCIPKLAGYKGKAIYMDADMQVFKDIKDLWNIPFNGAKVLVQKEVKHTDLTMLKVNAPKVRKKQCAVMILDCERLDWNVEDIVSDMNQGKYSYDELMSEMCIVPESEIGYSIPFEWNSLEYFDEDTCLIHYTDMGTQPWVSSFNPNGKIWFDEVAEMLENGALNIEDIKREIDLGYFRPSLLRDIKFGRRIPSGVRKLFNLGNAFLDRKAGFVAHKAVYEAKKLRLSEVNKYQQQVANQKTV